MLNGEFTYSDDKIVDYIPFIELLDDQKTIVDKNGYLLQTISIEGIDISCVSEEKKHSLFEKRHYLYQKLDNDIYYSFYTLRVPSTIPSLKGGNNHLLKEMNQARSMDYKGAYENTSYVVFAKKIDAFDIEKISWSESKTKELIYEDLRLLNNQVEKFKEYFHELNAKVLTFNNGLMSFWDVIINNSSQTIWPLKLSGSFKNLNHYLGNVSYNINCDSGVVKYVDNRHFGASKQRYSSYIMLKVLPSAISQEVFERVFNIDAEIIFTQHAKAIEEVKANKAIHTKQRLYQTFSMFFRGSVDALYELGDKVQTGKCGLIDYVSYFRVNADSLEELRAKVLKLENCLQNLGIGYIYCKDIAIYHGYFPDVYNTLFNARGWKPTTENLSMLASFPSSKFGQESQCFGDEPIAYFKTLSHNWYGFNFHVGESEPPLGHTMIFGGSGKGKTTLITYLLTNCLKYENMHILAFDSKQGMRIATETFGGTYFDPIEDNLGLNPFMMENTQYNREFLISLMVRLTSANLKQKQLIEEAIEAIVSTNVPELQNIMMLTESLSKDDHLYNELCRWLPMSQSYKGKLFTSKEDLLKFNNNIISFDMDKVIADREVSDPLISYLFHSFENQVADSLAPHICFVDELHQYLNNPLFVQKLGKAASEWRKRKGLIIGAIQDVATFAKHPLKDVMRPNIANMIFFPDEGAQEEDYVNRLGLNQQEFQWVKETRANYQVLLKRIDRGSIILDVNLSSLGKYLRLFKSDVDSVEKLKRIKLSNPNNFVEEYLNA
ncbi:MAG: hypothetical protein J0G32_03790 [Alphaproteobacteria bacterium]|jgi:type IV secretion/conjugal transfer VirB4 family ATPase|nr:hypothetical protein [Alphaproteobacteria bacterium]OJV12551.1 MAG: hypothetical protein BGO27_03405 [Alphaproteobacteria bacterium 33-17]